MPSSDNQSVPMFGPWQGIMEYPLPGDPTYVEDALNVEFDGDIIRKRKGRQYFTKTTTVRPAACCYLSGAGGNYIDVTSVLTDDPSSVVNPGSFAPLTTTPPQFYFQVGQEIYFGFGCPVNGISITIPNAYENSNAQSAALGYWNGASYVSLGTIASPAFNTNAVFSYNWVTPSDWKPQTLGGFTDLYWVRLNASGVFSSNFAISEVRGSLNGWGAQTSMKTAVNGLFEYQRADGTKRLLVAMDDAAGSAGGVAGQSPIARLFYYDDGADELVSVNLPNASKRTGSDARWRFVVFENQLIGTNGYGPLVRYDGTNCYKLEAVTGTDSASQAYLTEPPQGKYLAVYNQCLYVAGDPRYPQTIFQSQYSNADALIPADGSAPAGAANLWPADKNFDCTTPGFEPITGMRPLSGWLIIFKRESIWNWDDSSLFKSVNGVGCVAPDTIQPFQGAKGNEFLFVGYGALYSFNGIGVQEVLHLQDTMRNQVNLGAASGATSVKFAARRQIRISLPLRAGAKNTLTLVHTYDHSTWTKFGEAFYAGSSLITAPAQAMEIAASCTTSSATEEERLISGDYNGDLWVEDIGQFDNGAAVPAYVLFRPIGLGQETPLRFRRVRIEADLTGANIDAYVLLDGNRLGNYGDLLRIGLAAVGTGGAYDVTLNPTGTWYGLYGQTDLPFATNLTKVKLSQIRADLWLNASSESAQKVVGKFGRVLLKFTGPVAACRGIVAEFRARRGGR